MERLAFVQGSYTTLKVTCPRQAQDAMAVTNSLQFDRHSLARYREAIDSTMRERRT